MDESRVEKYKNYRTKLISNGAPTNTKRDNRLVDTLNTSTIPIKEVYSSLDEDDNKEEDLYRLELKKTRLKIIFTVIFLALLAAAIVVFAIFAFK